MERLLAHMRVAEVHGSIVTTAATVAPDASIAELLEKILEDPRTRHVYVVDEAGRLLGSVRLVAVLRHLFPYTSLPDAERASPSELLRYLAAATAAEIMNPAPRYVTEDASMLEVVRLMVEENLGELPVVDAGRRVVGEVNFLEIVAACLGRRG